MRIFFKSNYQFLSLGFYFAITSFCNCSQAQNNERLSLRSAGSPQQIESKSIFSKFSFDTNQAKPTESVLWSENLKGAPLLSGTPDTAFFDAWTSDYATEIAKSYTSINSQHPIALSIYSSIGSSELFNRDSSVRPLESDGGSVNIVLSNNSRVLIAVQKITDVYGNNLTLPTAELSLFDQEGRHVSIGLAEYTGVKQDYGSINTRFEAGLDNIYDGPLSILSNLFVSNTSNQVTQKSLALSADTPITGTSLAFTLSDVSDQYRAAFLTLSIDL